MSAGANGRVVIVDDDAILVRAYERCLRFAGFDVKSNTSPRHMLEGFENGSADVVIADIGMPEMDGLGLLAAVRKIDPDVPVLLVTGMPTIDTAIAAIETGALRYLVKPIVSDELVASVTEATRLCKLARLRREATRVAKSVPPPNGRSTLRDAFDRAMDTLYMAYQPIVDVTQKDVFGHEALVRTRESSIPHPGALFATAEKLGMLPQLARKIRMVAPHVLEHLDPSVALFVNLHPRELADEQFAREIETLLPVATRIVFEVSERVSIDDLGRCRARLTQLRQQGFGLAVDDLGAGYAGLTSFALLEPEIVKLDMSLIRGVESSSIKQKVIGSLISLCTEMNVRVIGEGVETQQEADVLLELGCTLQQGYLHARPAFPIPNVTWP